MPPALSSVSVSVIMPVFNAAEHLEATIASVIGQSLPDWELLAVDDGSTDDSAAILARLAGNDPRIRVMSTGGNLGAGDARNHAMAAARGPAETRLAVLRTT